MLGNVPSDKPQDDWLISQDEMANDKYLFENQFRGLLFDSIPIKIAQKGVLIQLMHQEEIREILADILSEVGTSVRLIESHEVIKLIADIIRFVLTLFVHE